MSFKKECFEDHCNVSCECGKTNWRFTTENCKIGDTHCCEECDRCFTIGVVQK